MSYRKFLAVFFPSLVVIILACNKEEDPPVVVPEDTGVNVDLQSLPYEKLSDYRFFIGSMKEMIPNEDVLPFEPITPLFSDYAHKSRFIWMPEGVSATYVADDLLLQFPNGTILIKSFYYDHVLPTDTRKMMETRIMYRRDDAWHFADYLWNDEQTEATFSLDGDVVPVEWVDDLGNNRSVDFRIPAESECFTCHKVSDQNHPIGPKPQNLNKTYNYAEGPMNQLAKWKQVGYLSGDIPMDIVTVADWTDTSAPLEERIRAYIDMNCAHCHQENSHCSYRPMRFSYTNSSDPVNMGICVEPQEFISGELTHVISRGNILRSVIYFRMNTTDVQFRMPLMGRTLIHDEAVALMEEYIESLSPSCP